MSTKTVSRPRDGTIQRPDAALDVPNAGLSTNGSANNNKLPQAG